MPNTSLVCRVVEGENELPVAAAPLVRVPGAPTVLATCLEARGVAAAIDLPLCAHVFDANKL